MSCTDQGESDTRDLQLAESYATRLTALINNLREDLAAPRVPFLIGGLGHWLNTHEVPDGKGGVHVRSPTRPTPRLP